MLDLIVRNGRVFDGTGAAPRELDIGIKDGRIALIGERIDEPAEQHKDVRGLWVLPGFIDIHTHYDLEVEVAPALAESVRHGVTTVVMGNCSLSLTLGEPETLADIFLRVETLPSALVRKWLTNAVSWKTAQDYLAHLNALNLGPNVAPMLGHSALRAEVMGLERGLHEHADENELSAMRRLAEEALDAGCIGISVDMVHWHKMSGDWAGRALPSHHAGYREYAMLADVCRERDAVFQVTPNPREWRSFVDILRLSIGLFRPPLRATVLAALDMVGKPQLWRVFPFVLFLFNRLLGSNLRFQTLTEPFTIYSDGPITPLFEEFAAGVRLNNCTSRSERDALWREPGFRSDFRRDWQAPDPRSFHRDPSGMRIVAAPDPDLTGKTIADVAKDRGSDPIETLMDLLTEHDEELRWVSTGANHRAPIRQRLMAHPHILPGFTDAGAHARNLAYFDGALTLLRESVASGFIPPEKAIHRVTGEPARWFNLDTGTLHVGAQADLLVVDPIKLEQPGGEMTQIRDARLGGATRLVKRGGEEALASVYIAGTEVARTGEMLQEQKTGRVLTPHRRVRGRRAVLQRYRNRIDDGIVDHRLNDYWDVFVSKHQHPRNLFLHCLAVLIMYGCVVWAVAAQNPWLLLLVPLSQLTGFAGHLLYEPSHVDTRDFVFSWRAFTSLNRMFVLVITGQYGGEVKRVRQQLHNASAGNTSL